VTEAAIEEIRAYEVVVPANARSVDSSCYQSAKPWYLEPIVLIEMLTDDGLTSVGECGRGHSLAACESSLKRLPGIILRALSMDVLPPEWRMQPLGGLQSAYPPALWQSSDPVLWAMEIAILDWAGRRMDCRAVDLLGGAHRNEVPVEYWCGRQTPQDIRDIAARAAQRGFTGLKMKSQLGDPVAEQIDAVVREAGPHFHVTIDPMFQWISPRDALSTFISLERWNAQLLIEDPFPQDQPEMWERARSRSSIPLAWHARTIQSLKDGLRYGCADTFNCSGGIWEFMTLAHAIEVHGLACWHGTGIELGVSQAAHLHTAAAARSCTNHSDFVSAIVREHTLVDWDWPYREGRLPLPPGHGIGVQLDHQAIKHYIRAKAIFRQQ
jgi:muconate cycloisomerase